MKVEDRHIQAALRLGKMGDLGFTPDDVPNLISSWLRDSIKAHALTLAKLECAVEALAELTHTAGAVHNLGARTGTQWFRLGGSLITARSALTQIRSESHE